MKETELKKEMVWVIVAYIQHIAWLNQPPNPNL